MIRKLSIIALLLIAGCTNGKYDPRDYSTFSCSEMDAEIQLLSRKIKKKDLGRNIKNGGQVALLTAAAAGAPWLIPIIGVPAVETVYDTRTQSLYNERTLLRNMKGYHCYVGPTDGGRSR